MKPCADAPRAEQNGGKSRATREMEKGFEKVLRDLL